LFVCADNLINVALGNRWAESGSILAVLAIAGFVQPTASTRGLVLITTGKDKRYFRLGVANAVVYVTAFVLGIRWNTVGVASAYAIANYAMLYPSLSYSYRDSPIRVKDYFESVARAGVASIGAGVAAFTFKHNVPIFNDLLMLCSSGFVFVCCYILVFVATPGGRAELGEYWRLRTYIGRQRPHKSPKSEGLAFSREN
jgi:PST family polysaccharide transporter